MKYEFITINIQSQDSSNLVSRFGNRGHGESISNFECLGNDVMILQNYSTGLATEALQKAFQTEVSGKIVYLYNTEF